MAIKVLLSGMSVTCGCLLRLQRRVSNPCGLTLHVPYTQALHHGVNRYSHQSFFIQQNQSSNQQARFADVTSQQNFPYTSILYLQQRNLTLSSHSKNNRDGKRNDSDFNTENNNMRSITEKVSDTLENRKEEISERSVDKLKERKEEVEEDESKLTIFQRFKKVYKEYGKTLLAVHVTTSIVWYGAFYLVAKSGIDLTSLLTKVGASEKIIDNYHAAGDFLVAYIIYEIAKPVRYLFTLAATRQTVRFLRNRGYFPQIKPEDRLRNLAKEGRDNLRDRYHERRDDIKEKYAGKKAVYTERWNEVRQKMKRNSVKYKTGQQRRSNGQHRNS